MNRAIKYGSCALHLFPAFGRKYNNRDEALADWHRGKDFRIYQGPYCSIRDLEILSEEFNRGYIYHDRGIVQVF